LCNKNVILFFKSKQVTRTRNTSHLSL